MKIKIREFFKSKYIHIIVCAILTLLATMVLLPYLQADRHSGHDLKYHFSVIRSLKIAWEEGNFFNKIMEVIGGDYGYGTGIFYSTFPAAICVVLMKILHVSQTAALYLEMVLLFAVSAIVVYFFLYRVFKKVWIAAICAASYIVYPYFLWDLFVRFAFTEIFLMLAMPLIVWGVYELLYQDNHFAFYPLFICGYSLAIFTHFTMTVYITIFLAVWLLIEWKKTFALRKIIPFAIATGIVLLITACYYLPMLINYGVTDTSSMSKTPEQIKTNTTKYYTEKILTLDFTYIFLVFIIYTVYYALFANDKRTNGKTTLLVVSALILFLYNPVFPWKVMPNFLRMIQYTFRILLFAGITTPLMIGILLKEAFVKEVSVKEKSDDNANKENIFHTFSALCKANFSKESIARNLPKIMPKVGRLACQILLIVSLLYTYQYARLHNADMPKSLYNNASSTTYGDDAINLLTGNSEFNGLGANKHGDYFPINCTRNYLSSRIQKSIVHSANVSLSELAIYDSLSQISFLAGKSTNGYVVLHIPYSVLSDVEFYRYTTNSKNQQITVSATEYNQGKTYLTLGDYNGESKIILSYKNAPDMQAYLQEKAFTVLPISGDVSVSNFQKARAGKYSFDVTTTADGGVLELPSYYYKGYRIILTDEDGKKHKLQATHGANGFIEVEIPESGNVKVQFISGYLVISYLLTGLGVLSFAGIITYFIYQKKETTNSPSPLNENGEN